MKIGFYNPYFDSLSGGERYTLTLASHWSKKHDVSLFWDDPAIVEKAEKRLGIGLSKIRTVENVFQTKNIFRKLFVSRKYDLIFFLSDGSIPTTFARYNILHFQVPFQTIRTHSVKLARYNAIVSNSEFTQRNLTIPSTVIYPPVVPITEKSNKKNVILSVGRFHPLKKQDVLIEAFRRGNFSGYELVLAGGLMPADTAYAAKLRSAAGKLPVRIVANCAFDEIAALYRQAKIYWHAAGYHETKPENMEHFGISTVEAMSAGCIPIVFSGGGLPEIVREGESGYLWAGVTELIEKTKKATQKTGMVKNVQERAKNFGVGRFTGAYDALLTRITA